MKRTGHSANCIAIKNKGLYKVGDVVRLVNYSPHLIQSDMGRRFAGQTVTIKRIGYDYITTTEKGCMGVYFDEIQCLVIPNPKSKRKQEVHYDVY